MGGVGGRLRWPVGWVGGAERGGTTPGRRKNARGLSQAKIACLAKGPGANRIKRSQRPILA